MGEITVKPRVGGHLARLILTLATLALAAPAGAFREGTAGISITARLGLTILAVAPGSPAARKGLMKGDVILSVDDRDIAGIGDFLAVVGQRPGQDLKIVVARNGRLGAVTIRLGSVAAQQGEPNWRGRKGILGVHLHQAAGVIVAIIEPGSPAEAAGLEPNDVIIGIDGQPLASAVAARDALSDRPGETVHLHILRNAELFEGDLRFGASPGTAPATAQVPPAQQTAAGGRSTGRAAVEGRWKVLYQYDAATTARQGFDWAEANWEIGPQGVGRIRNAFLGEFAETVPIPVLQASFDGGVFRVTLNDDNRVYDYALRPAGDCMKGSFTTRGGRPASGQVTLTRWGTDTAACADYVPESDTLSGAFVRTMTEQAELGERCDRGDDAACDAFEDSVNRFLAGMRFLNGQMAIELDRETRKLQRTKEHVAGLFRGNAEALRNDAAVWDGQGQTGKAAQAKAEAREYETAADDLDPR